MGVQKLSTFLKENRRSLGETKIFTKNDPQPLILVVDGWSVIYSLYKQSMLPWVYGGEYEAFSRLLQNLCRGFLELGFTLYFVLDGPYPALKVPEIARRFQDARIDTANLFFRTSIPARSTPSFLAHNAILPPLVFRTAIDALDALKEDGVTCIFADGEGDPTAVAVASALGGFVLGQDSDYVILNGPNYQGYIPIEELVWNLPLGEEDDSGTDDGFQTVRSKRRPPPTTITRSLLPPETFDSLTLTVYHPDRLAKSLNIGPGLLPLLASLLGNDFTPYSLSRNFFYSSMPISERIQRASTIIREVFHPSKHARRRRSPLAKAEAEGTDKVTVLIHATVSDLLLRDHGEKEQLAFVESIRDSIWQYLLPEVIVPTAESDEIQILSSSSAGPFSELDASYVPSTPQQEEVRRLYTDAYQAGKLAADLVGLFTTGTAFPTTLFLEDPDVKSSHEVVGAPLRQWLYAILADGMDGIGEQEKEGDGDATPTNSDSEEDPDELIDVAEDWSSEEEEEEGFEVVTNGGTSISRFSLATEDPDQKGFATDPLVLLRHQLEPLRVHERGEIFSPMFSEGGGASGADSLVLERRAQLSRPRVINEYSRRGTKLVSQNVRVIPLGDLLSRSPSSASLFPPQASTIDDDSTPSHNLPIQLQSEHARLALFLRAMGVLSPSTFSVSESSQNPIALLPPPYRLFAASLRWAIIAIATRATPGTAGGKWTQSEARALIQSAVDPSTSNLASEDVLPTDITPRSIHLTSVVITSLKTASFLAQALLLTHSADSSSNAPVPLPSPALFSGRRFHLALERSILSQSSVDLSELGETIWEAVSSGLDSSSSTYASTAELDQDRDDAMSISTFTTTTDDISMGGLSGGGYWAEEAWERARSRKEAKRREKARMKEKEKQGKAKGATAGVPGAKTAAKTGGVTKFDLLAGLNLGGDW